MKTILTLTVFLILSATATAAETRRLDCRSAGGQIVTSEGRLIFVSEVAVVEIGDKDLSISLQSPNNGTVILPLKKVSSTKVEASKAERVYPSGSIARSYVVEDSVKLNGTKLSVKNVKKRRFKKDEIMYIGEYDCL